MSEKFNWIWRKVREAAGIFVFLIPITLGVLLTGSTIVMFAVLKGLIFSACWNVAMTTMFGLNTLTLFQACVLTLTLGCIRANYYSSAKSDYTDFKEKISGKFTNEKITKVVSIILVILVDLISICIAIQLVMYSWNNIVTQLLNVELVKINFIQALGFAYLFNHFFHVSKSDDKKVIEDLKNKKEADKTDNNIIDVIEHSIDD